MRILSALGYRAITPDNYVRFMKGESCVLPEKPFLLTFDDGFLSVFHEALPVMKELGFTAVVFVVSSALGGPAFWDGETDPARHRIMTREELRSLLDVGWAVGSHSRTHPRLANMSDRALTSELVDSKRSLEDALGREIFWFAYPFGEVNVRLKEAVRRTGYQIAFATETGDGDLFSIRRRTIRGSWIRFFLRLMQARRLARQ